MNIGKLIPAAKLLPGQTRKVFFSEHSKQVMRTIKALVPADDPSLKTNIRDERFELEIKIFNSRDEQQTIPQQYKISHPDILANFFHRPMILYIFSRNLEIPTLILEKLDTRPAAFEIAKAIQAIIDVLNGDFPYLLSYRVGAKVAETIKLSLIELQALAQWAEDADMTLEIDPIRHYFAVDQNKEIKQDFIESWM
jgi:hypothetical protein